MGHRRGAAVLGLALLGCGQEPPPAPASAREPPPPTLAPAPPPPPVASAPASAPPVESARPPAPAPPRFVLVELAPAQGDLLPLLRAEAERAQKSGLRPAVEFYADWCAPCRAFQASLRDPEMAAALAGTHLVKLNMDDWHDKLRGTGYDVRSIPSFYLVGAEGRPAGKPLDGGAWGRATPARMGEALRAFFRG
jgi:thiol-disulfide isomerase/thioredoxin